MSLCVPVWVCVCVCVCVPACVVCVVCDYVSTLSRFNGIDYINQIWYKDTTAYDTACHKYA